MKLAQLFEEILEKLNSHYSINEAKAISYSLLQHYRELSRTQVLAFPEIEISEEVMQKINVAVQQLQTHKPLQYILGETSFCDLPINVSEAVLIPRPETEELVSWIKEDINVETQSTMADLCTGSGCIAIALKKMLPKTIVWACDISFDALQVANENALKNRVEVNFWQCDMLSEKINLESDILFSVIVSNPPYIRDCEKLLMKENVLNYEPHLALFVDDNDPLIFYRAIINFAKARLQKNGVVYVEINEAFGNEVKELFYEKGFSEITLRKDIHGKDRMIKAVK